MAVVCGLWLCWAGGAAAQSAAPTGEDVARSVIAGDLRPLLGAASVTRFGVIAIGSEAMTPTLAVDDRVIYDRAAYVAVPPSRGDLIIFRPTPSALRTCGGGGLYVERVIGTEGDVVRAAGRTLLVNGIPLVVTGARSRHLVRRFAAVPAGRVLVLGDNGPGACDSSQWPNPFVPTSYIVGRVDGVVWPRARAGLLPAAGGVERLNPAGVERDRLDAAIGIGRGHGLIAEELARDRLLVAIAIREQRRALRALLAPLEADCAAAPIRTLRRALGKDFHAALDRRVGLGRLALRLRVHHTSAVAAIAACWAPAAGSTVPALTR